MKTLIVQNGSHDSFNASIDQIEMRTKTHQHFSREDFSQGSEFLDDAIRIHEQALASVGAGLYEDD